MFPSLLIAMAALVGLPPGLANQNQDILVFFYVVNVSGVDVNVKVQADGREIFAYQLPAKVVPRPQVKEVPTRGDHPALEVKIRLNRNTRKLEVQELNSNRKAKFNVRNFAKRDRGFRITIKHNKVELKQDYYPIYTSGSPPRAVVIDAAARE